MVELQPSKLIVWVRFPSSAPKKIKTPFGVFSFWSVMMTGIEQPVKKTGSIIKVGVTNRAYKK